jgi:hypothetical protein
MVRRTRLPVYKRKGSLQSRDRATGQWRLQLKQVTGISEIVPFCRACLPRREVREKELGVGLDQEYVCDFKIMCNTAAPYQADCATIFWSSTSQSRTDFAPQRPSKLFHLSRLDYNRRVKLHRIGTEDGRNHHRLSPTCFMLPNEYSEGAKAHCYMQGPPCFISNSDARENRLFGFCDGASHSQVAARKGGAMRET